MHDHASALERPESLLDAIADFRSELILAFETLQANETAGCLTEPERAPTARSPAKNMQSGLGAVNDTSKPPRQAAASRKLARVEVSPTKDDARVRLDALARLLASRLGESTPNAKSSDGHP